MKKLISLLLVLALALSFAACKAKIDKDPTDTDPSADPASTSQAGESQTDVNGNVIPSNIPDGAVTGIKEIFDPMEYTLYYNIFYQDQGDTYDGLAFTKVGTLARIQDEWSGKMRYYVWGYNDKTRCCDYQWEFVPEDPDSLPGDGSYIQVKGTFSYTEDQKTGALDHYWLTDTEVKVFEEYTPAAYDYDLTTMSATLARVQLFSIQNYTAKFAGKTVLVYGRALSVNQLQHPYYNESWSLDFKDDEHTPAIGQYLVLGGTVMTEGEGCWLQVSSYREV